jgi:lysozyme
MLIKHAHYPNGIDVSDNNGEFDWHSWNGHIDFAMIKATEGPVDGYPYGIIDTQFERNWYAAKAIGLHRFAYHFFHPEHDPSQQAHWFVDAVKAQGLDFNDNLVIDFEQPSGTVGVNQIVHDAFAAYVFVKEVQRLAPQRRVLVYTYPYFAEQGYCALLGDYDLWIADWGVSSPSIPVPFKSWRFWQYVGTGVDLDRYNGTEKDLENFCTN